MANWTRVTILTTAPWATCYGSLEPGVKIFLSAPQKLGGFFKFIQEVSNGLSGPLTRGFSDI